MLHERTQIEDRHQDGEEGAPHACPKIKRHELHVHSNCQIIDDKRVGQERTGGSKNREGLTGKSREDQTADTCTHYHFHHSELAVRAVKEPTAESNRRSKGGDEPYCHNWPIPKKYHLHLQNNSTLEKFRNKKVWILQD